jgi:hypothetical protein
VAASSHGSGSRALFFWRPSVEESPDKGLDPKGDAMEGKEFQSKGYIAQQIFAEELRRKANKGVLAPGGMRCKFSGARPGHEGTRRFAGAGKTKRITEVVDGGVQS